MKPKPRSIDPNPHTVPVLCKALRVFEALANRSDGMTAKELAISLEISRTTCYRILQSFVVQGWLNARRGGIYELSFALAPFLQPLVHHELIETLREPLRQVAVRAGLTAKLIVRQGDDAETLASATSPATTAVTSCVDSMVSFARGPNRSVPHRMPALR